MDHERFTVVSEAAPKIAFNSELGLNGIFNTLLQMREKGIVLEGSAKEYTPEQLASKLMEAKDAIDKAVQEAGFEKNFEVRELLPRFSEVAAITRAGGLREAFIDVMAARIPFKDLEGDSEYKSINMLLTLQEATSLSEDARLKLVGNVATQLGVDSGSEAGRIAILEEIERIRNMLLRK